MLKKIWDYVNQNQMIQEQDKLVVGVSGGADSVCLVLVLLEISKKIPLSLEIAHLHHGIRGEEADRDAHFVEELCKMYHLPFHLKKENVPKIAKAQGLSEEEAGRNLRYAFFREVANQTGAQKIAVAHNKNDQAETMLFHLIRGTGLKGLCGIPSVNGMIIRPLLCVERQEIEHFLQEKEVSFCSDSTNLGEDYTRNKIRNKLLPYIRETINPGVVDAMYRAGENLRQVAEYVDAQVDNAEETYLKKTERGLKISGRAFSELPKALVSELILRGFETVAESKKDFSEKHREMIFQLIEGETGKNINLPGGVMARNEYGELHFEKMAPIVEPEFFCMEIPLENGRYYINEQEYVEISVDLYKKDEIISEKKYTKWFDYDIIKGTLCVRNRKNGDRITIDKNGGTKKLKDYFINEKIYRKERDALFLLADEQEVLWIIGYRISEAYKITEHTKRVLKVRYGGNTYGTKD